MSLSKTLYRLLSTGSTQEDVNLSRHVMTEKLLTGTLSISTKLYFTILYCLASHVALFPFQLPERPLSSLHSSFENEAFSLHSGVLSPDTTLMPPPQLTDFMNQMSMPPVSMPGPIGDLTFPGLPHAHGPPHPIVSGISHTALEGRSCSRNSHSPTMSDSGISVDAASTNSNSSAPLVNIAALAKLGTVGYSSQGMRSCSGLSDPISGAPSSNS